MTQPNPTSNTRPPGSPGSPGLTPAQFPLLACFFYFCWLVLFYSLGDIPLSGRSEGRYASTSMAMADSNQWLVPQFMGKSHLTKPPFTYWLQAGSLKVFGHGEFAVRFPSAFAGAATILMVFLLMRKTGGTLTGLTAAGTLAVMPLHVVISRLTLTDSLLGMFWFGALAAGFLAVKEPDKKRWPVLMWIAVALGMLTKAHLGLMPVGLLALWLALGGRWKEKSALKLLWGLPLACLPLLAWASTIVASHPGAITLWKKETADRLIGSGDHPKPFPYFIPVFIGGMFPATAMLMLPGLNLSWRSAWSKIRRGEDAALWAIAIVVPFLLFSINKGKLPSYMLPLGPPLAILTGLMLADWLRGKHDPSVVGRDAFGHRPTKPPEVRGALLVISLVLAIGAACAFVLPMPTIERGIAKATDLFDRASAPFSQPPVTSRTSVPPSTQPAATQAHTPPAAAPNHSDFETATAVYALKLLQQRMPWLPVIPLLAAVFAIWLFAVWGKARGGTSVPMLRRALPLTCLWLMMIFGWVSSLQIARVLTNLANNASMIADIESLSDGSPTPKLATFGYRDATLTFYLRQVVPFKNSAKELDEWIMAYPNEAIIIASADLWDGPNGWAAKHPIINSKLEEIRRWQLFPTPAERVILRPRAGLMPAPRSTPKPSEDLPEDDDN